MASSSSTTSAAAAAGTTYQVFLSFRGPDTRQGFTNVLYHALVDAGVRVFMDDEEMREGEKIDKEILRAIEQSRILMPIFSRGYASSKWCLLEFAKMVELEKGSSGQKIIPIFYDVGVEDVKLMTGLYTGALKEHSEKWGAETVKQWEDALRQAGKSKGWELKDQGHAEFAKLVARNISMKLEVKQKCITEHFVERDDQVEAIMELLDIESSGAQFVGIYGMGGIGKTTLAKIVFNKICDRFDCASFLTDVRESSGQHKGIEHLQEQLLRDLGLKSGEIRDVYEGIKRIREFLSRKKVLIVLDDVDHKKQIHSLARDPSWFGSRSRIIITSRNKEVLEMEALRSRTLEIEVMKPKEARELFCMHAFKEGTPPGGYLRLLENVVASTGRLPLALEVIGSHLRDKYYEDWLPIIKKLEKVPHADVQKKLMISYEALSQGAKQIFLDIACFFIGEEKTDPIYMWRACDFDSEMGLEDLVDMSLVKVIKEEDKHGKILTKERLWMHDQLRDLGRQIANSSRPWSPKDALKMLRDKEDTKQVEMLRSPDDGYTFSHKEILSLRKLRYLECSRVNFPRKLKDKLPKLRWLCWSFSHQEIKGTSVCFRNLVILNLSQSDIDEKWSGWGQIGVGSTLKVLNLSYCDRLTRTPDLSSYPSLERFILQGCSKLVLISPSISKLKALKHLDVSCCDSLENFPEEIGSLYNLEVVLASSDNGTKHRFHTPESFGDLTSLLIFQVQKVKLPQSIANLARLRRLSLFGCSGLALLQDTLGDMKSLVQLDLSRTDVTELPDTIGQLVKLEVLSLRECKNLKKLPVSIGNMRSLVKLDLSYSEITGLPDSIGMLKRLEELDASGTPLEDIPLTIEGLRVFKSICAYRLRLLPPKLPTGLTDVDISSSEILHRVPEFSNLHSLARLVLQDDIYRSRPSEVRPLKLRGIGGLCRLVELRLDLWNLTCIPEEDLSSLPQLQKLTLGCPNLQHCPPLPSTLSDLIFWGPREMTKLPGLSNLKNLLTLGFQQCFISHDIVGNLGFGELASLTTLSLIGCAFGNLEGLHLPANLRKLHIDRCESLEALLALSHDWKNLEELTIKGAHELVQIPEVGELESLQKLSIDSCDSIETLPNLSKLKSLRWIEISWCKNFKGINSIRKLESLEYLQIRCCGCEDVLTIPRKRPFEDMY